MKRPTITNNVELLEVVTNIAKGNYRGFTPLTQLRFPYPNYTHDFCVRLPLRVGLLSNNKEWPAMERLNINLKSVTQIVSNEAARTYRI